MKQFALIVLYILSSCSSPEIVASDGEPGITPNPYNGESPFRKSYVTIYNISNQTNITIYNSKGDLVYEFKGNLSTKSYRWSLTDNENNIVDADTYKIKLFNRVSKKTSWLNFHIEKAYKSIPVRY